MDENKPKGLAERIGEVTGTILAIILCTSIVIVAVGFALRFIRWAFT